MGKQHVTEFEGPIHQAWCVGYGSYFQRYYRRCNATRRTVREYGADVWHKDAEIIWVDWDGGLTNGDLYVSQGGALVHQGPATERQIEDEILRIFNPAQHAAMLARRLLPPRVPTRRLPRVTGAFTDELKPGDLFAEVTHRVEVHYALNRTAKNLTFRDASPDEIAGAGIVHVPTDREWSDVYARRPGAQYVDSWDNNPSWETKSREEILALGPLTASAELVMRTYERHVTPATVT